MSIPFFEVKANALFFDGLLNVGLYQKKYPNADMVKNKPAASTSVLRAIFMKILLGIDS